MAWIKTALLTTAILATTLSQAAPKPSNDGAQNNAKAPAHPPYGENPNIFKVFAYKTQEKVINTADKVGEATENGISKIKPKLDQAWDTVTSAPNGVVPIESKPLSQSSAAPQSAPAAPQPQPQPQPQPPIVAPSPSATPAAKPTIDSTQTPAQSNAPADARPASQPISNAEPLPQLAPLKPAQADAPASDKAQSAVFYL